MASIRQVLVPEIGDFKDVPVIEVMVRPGDLVKVDDALITIESDKATIDVPAPFGGAVTQLKIKVGDRVSAGTPIVEIEAADQPIASVVALGSPDFEDSASETRAPPAGAPASPPAPPGRSPPAGPVESVDGPAGPTPHASPSVRRFARELGVGLGSLSGTGPQSRILKEDVQSFVRSFLVRPGVSGIADGTPGSAPQTRMDFARFGPVERQPSPHAARGVRNGSAIPHAVHFDEADITRLDSFREEAGEAAAKEGIELTLLAFLLKVSVAALKQYPIFNASLDGEDIVLKRHYHLGFAVDTPGGPAVPVIRDVDQKGVLRIGRELGELTARAQAGQLTADDVEGASFTVSSLDGIGGTGFTPVINAPDVAVLGVARAARRLVEVDGQIVPRLMLPLALSYDLRVIHGAAAARFTRALAAMLEDVRRACL
jgi:pyruvate dehydrogenase E2 component (dihydrolipoamide acetyltransferase)